MAHQSRSWIPPIWGTRCLRARRSKSLSQSRRTGPRSDALLLLLLLLLIMLLLLLQLLLRTRRYRPGRAIHRRGGSSGVQPSQRASPAIDRVGRVVMRPVCRRARRPVGVRLGSGIRCSARGVPVRPRRTRRRCRRSVVPVRCSCRCDTAAHRVQAPKRIEVVDRAVGANLPELCGGARPDGHVVVNRLGPTGVESTAYRRRVDRDETLRQVVCRTLTKAVRHEVARFDAG